MPYQLNLTKTNIASVKDNYKEQIKSLNDFFYIINNCVKNGVPRNSLSFGGGTALAMYYLGYRKSFDIDFIY